MSQHVYTRLAGFQLTVIPRAPFRIERTDAAPDALDVHYRSPEGPLFARLIPHEGGYKSKLDQNTASLYEVLDVDLGPSLDDWRLETSIFSCAWPRGFGLFSNRFPQDPGPFDLLGDNREMIFIQKPRKLPALEDMCAPNQKVEQFEKTAEAEWIELAYSHEGLDWIQRYEIVRLNDVGLVVTMQSPGRFATDAIAAARQVAESLKPSESGE